MRDAYAVFTGDVDEALATLFFDAILCDPPYGLSFMGKAWDHGVPGPETWASLLRVVKPGGHLMAFGGTRTFHRLAVAIEDAGWEIRDTLCWLYGSGFPKSKNLDGAFDGYGTALKPAWEPIILAMRPIDGTYAHNALTHGVAGLNIDGGRITADSRPLRISHGQDTEGKNTYGSNGPGGGSHAAGETTLGRWPANVALDEEAAGMLDAQSGITKSGASRFFYCAKASRSEREAGAGAGANHHPTVKPLALARWLATLLLPPKRETPRRLLVPFSGSGSEMIGCLQAGWDEVVGIEMDPDYVAIARDRLAHWTRGPQRTQRGPRTNAYTQPRTRP